MEKTKLYMPVVERDEWLHPVADAVAERHNRYLARKETIEKQSGTIVDYANGYRYFGWQWDDALCGWWFREWLPEAYDVFIFGDFNSWQRTQLRLDKSADGVWSIFLPDAMYGHLLTHGSLYKLHVH
ncbi:MAG: 1,4-alpha-glucan-branching enzyme, partial [Alistipes sp.]|nr:1,4-alpha-glucan-branching enzyme [Alistipes sp.]